MEDLFYQYNPWWEDSFQFAEAKPREKYLATLRKNIDNKYIVILTGLRRVGKTTLMKLIVKQLLKQNVDSKHILYISLDDYLLDKKSIIDIVNEYRQILKIKIEEKIYLLSQTASPKLCTLVQGFSCYT